MAQVNNLLFALLLLLCSTLCLSVYATSNTENVVLDADVFKSEKISQVETLTEGSKIEITPQKIKPPALFAATKDGVIVVIAETNYKKNGGDDLGDTNGEKVDVVSRNFETNSEGKWPTEVFANVNGKWKTQLATENDIKEKKFSKIIASTVNADRSKVYVFLLNITDQGGSKKWNFKLVEGSVGGGAGDKTIKWEKESLTFTKDDKDIKQKFNGNVQDLSLADGSVFITEEQQFVLILKGTITGTDKAVKKVTIFFQFKKGAQNNDKLELLENNIVEGWFSFFQWKGEIFRTPIDLIAGSNEMTLLDVRSKRFNTAEDPIACLRDFLKDKNSFAKAQIREKGDVLLFTQEKSEDNSKNVYLWMSDGTRVALA